MKLSRTETRWAVAAMDAMYPGSHDAGLAGIAAMDVEGFFAKLMIELPARVALGIRAALWVVALAPLFVLGRWATLARLARSDRERVVARLLASHVYVVRSLVLLLKAMGALLYVADGRVRTRLHPPPRQGFTELRTVRTKGARVA